MRKILFLILILICLATIKAKADFATENIRGLDEVSLQGTWVVYESNGFGNVYITKFTLNGDSESEISVYSTWGGENTRYLVAYFVGFSQTDTYVLHLLGDVMGANNYSLTTYNYIIKAFDGDTMELSNFEGTKTMKLRKENAYYAPINVDDKETDDRMFNLNGQEIITPQGVYIQNGEKKIAK